MKPSHVLSTADAVVSDGALLDYRYDPSQSPAEAARSQPHAIKRRPSESSTRISNGNGAPRMAKRRKKSARDHSEDEGGKDDDSVAVIREPDNSGPRRSDRFLSRLPIKDEHVDKRKGHINCANPDCRGGFAINRGCSVITCPFPPCRWSFCYWCHQRREHEADFCCGPYCLTRDNIDDYHKYGPGTSEEVAIQVGADADVNDTAGQCTADGTAEAFISISESSTAGSGDGGEADAANTSVSRVQAPAAVAAVDEDVSATGAEAHPQKKAAAASSAATQKRRGSRDKPPPVLTLEHRGQQPDQLQSAPSDGSDAIDGRASASATQGANNAVVSSNSDGAPASANGSLARKRKGKPDGSKDRARRAARSRTDVAVGSERRAEASSASEDVSDSDRDEGTGESDTKSESEYGYQETSDDDDGEDYIDEECYEPHKTKGGEIDDEGGAGGYVESGGDEYLRKMNKHEEKWRLQFENLCKYKELNGDCNVPVSSKEHKKLGIWVMVQRREYKKFKKGRKAWITQERINELEALGFVWKALKDVWRLRIEELRKYKELYGNCNVPQNSEDCKELGSWVNHQRTEYKKLKEGKKSKITQERIDELEALEFVWDVLGDAWRSRFEELCKYKERHGNCNVPQRSKDYKELGKWVRTQRQEHKKSKEGRKAKITQERIDELEALGFVWEAFKDKWRLRFEELRNYKERHGNCNVPRSSRDDKELGTWVNKQRQQYKKFKEGEKAPITQERIDELEALGFVWDVLGDAWRQAWRSRFEELCRYKELNGDCNVPYGSKDNKKLGTWVMTQRQEYRKFKEGKKTSITQDRVNELEALGFQWKLR